MDRQKRSEGESAESAEIGFEALHEKYHARLLRYSAYVFYKFPLRNDHFDRYDAEDIVSDAFAELYVRWEELPSHGEAGLLRWLRKTVKLKTYTFHRKQAAEPEKIELTDWLDMGETGWEGEMPEMAEQTDPMDDEFRLAAYVREIKKRLDPEQKRLFDCVILQRRTVQQAAEILRKKENTVRVELYRLRRTLRKKILPEVLGPEYVNYL